MTVRVARTPPEIAAATALVWEFFDFLRGRYPDMIGTIDSYIEVQDVRGQLARFADTFLPPRGECLLADHDGAFVGLVMVKRHDDRRGELNRMYVRASARGLGLGRALAQALIDEARQLGLAEIVLDGLYRHVEAIPLYRSLGFVDHVEPGAFAADDPRVFHMKLTLEG